MSQMEHLLNVYASRVARGHCADFLGYCEVADSEATGRLTPGLWLVWKYEGKNTLSYYINRRDTIRALATDMKVSESAVVPTVMKQIFEGLAAFHAAGLVHRDIKPLNIIFAEDVRRFKLIDLGACADLRSGTNYVPEESILDLNYCPPEQFVMPTDSPHLAKQGLLKLAISPMLWAKHKPDRFDTWSAGIVMLQLAVPAMRSDRALRNFNAAYGPKYGYDLAAWRRGTHLPQRDGALLEGDDGAGWELLQSLLAPRHIQVDDGGGVSFVNDSPFPRISAYEALKHSASLFSGLFGRPPPADAPPQPPQPQGKAPAAPSSAPPAASASSGPVLPPPAAATSATSGEALVEGANRVIRNSLGFTGLAAKIAGDLASALKADAERYFKEVETAEAAKRQQRTLELAFVALLREASPPVAASTSYEQAEAALGGEVRWAALADEGRRRRLFESFVAAAKKVEEQAAAAAEAGFRAALRRHNVTAASRWEDFAAQLPESDPTLAAVKDPARRQQLFLEVVAELQLQAALEAAAAKAEQEFLGLLAELRDPAVTSTSTWSLVRKAVSADPRCNALPERRRRELFEAYTADLFEQEARRADAAVAAADAEAEAEAAAAAAVAPAQPAAVDPVPAPAAAALPSSFAPPAVSAAVGPSSFNPFAPPAPAHTAATAPTSPPASSAATAPPPSLLSSSATAAPSGAVPSLAPAAAIDDDDLAAALEGMEAALESAIKAVAAAPLPSASLLGGVGGSGGSGAPPVAVAGNNVVSGPAATTANGRPKSAAGGSGSGSTFDGSRLEELRREQARLRSEYEAMAQRLREMEERLRGQAQLITSTPDDTPPQPPPAAGEVQPPAVAAAGNGSGGGGKEEADEVAAGASSNGNGVPAQSGNFRWW
ncbi:hypothetical protein GPECTOR_80g167 [Gonium pectorale]|uniref:Protein kinase domain-containing protein n=1 Tax=Gonium pectorale TaxID=33097 RepID=A0A150G1T0_GONPE|nr:hypothetical protein GPECTOR_80g167 [Gonium pectorale]|eukprot:KXZ43807.1 hypothetical protein GPECTOR_80g167 [Gonium pectorale]